MLDITVTLECAHDAEKKLRVRSCEDPLQVSLFLDEASDDGDGTAVVSAQDLIKAVMLAARLNRDELDD